MRYFVGGLLIAIGFFHGLHALGIDAGSVANLNGSRFLSFAALDRLASAGLMGKVIVLMIDGFLIALGILEITGRRLFSASATKKKPPPTP
jgi:hypothetical protein